MNNFLLIALVDVVIFIGIFVGMLTAIWVHLDFNLHNNLWTGGDVDPILNIRKAEKISSYVWMHHEELGLRYLTSWLTPYLFILKIIDALTQGNIILAHNVFLALLWSLAIFSPYTLTRYITKSRIAGLASIPFYVSFTHFLETINIVGTYHRIMLFTIPLIIYLIIKYFESITKSNLKSGMFYLIIASLISLFFVRLRIGGLLVYLFLSLIAYILHLQNVNFSFFSKKALQSILSLWLAVMIVWMPSIVNYYILVTSPKINDVLYTNYSTMAALEYSKLTLLDFVRGLSNSPWAWRNNFFQEISAGMFAFQGESLIKFNPLFRALSLSHVIIFAFGLLYITIKAPSNDRVKVYILSLIYVFVLFIDANFGTIFNVLSRYESLLIIRSLPRYSFYIIELMYLIMFSFLYRVGSKKLRSILLLFVLIQSIYAIYLLINDGNVFHPGTKVHVPEELFEVSRIVNNSPDEGRVLLVPFTRHKFGYVNYNFGYTGPDMLHWLIEKPIIGRHYAPMLSSNELRILNALAVNSDWKKMIKLLNIRWIILRKCLVYNKKLPQSFMLEINTTTYAEFLDSHPEYFEKVFEGSCFNLYRVKLNTSYFYIIPRKELVENNTTIGFTRISAKFVNITSFLIKVKYSAIKKNFTGDWRIDNYCIIDSSFVKVVFEPYGKFFVMLKYVNKANEFKIYSFSTYFPSYRFKIPTDVEIRFINNTLFVYINGLKLHSRYLPDVARLFSKDIIIGANLGRKETFNGKIEYILIKINNHTVIDAHSKNYANNLIPVSEYMMVNPTLWKVSIKIKEPAILLFSEAFDQDWIALIEKEKHTSFSCSIGLNCFRINKTGTLDMYISFKHQKIFEFSKTVCIVLLPSLLVIFFRLLQRYNWGGTENEDLYR